MKILLEPKLVIEKQEFIKKCKYRFNTYLIKQQYKNGDISIYNFFNDCLIYLTREEYDDILKKCDNFYVDNWFIVPYNFNEYLWAKRIRGRIDNSVKISSFDKIIGYTIMTTTDCNAQCYYCYEFGRKKIPMSNKVANDVADYIIKKYNGKGVNLSWFGGEPLYNESAIDIIVNKLKEKGINYRSSMISNGYLFDAEKIDKYKKDWKLSRVQITLDGTKDEYNSIKNYIYEDEDNAFEKVINNIRTLITNGIIVSVRLNLSSNNKNSLLSLIDYCHEQFKGNRYFSMYAHNIFDEEHSNDEEFLKGIYKDLDEVQEHIFDKFGRGGKEIKGLLSSKVCMANSGNSVVINPWGKIGVCEHFSESEFISDIYTDDFDKEVIKEWNERFEASEELCSRCPMYPSCYMLKKCENSECNKYKRDNNIKTFRNRLKRTVDKLLKIKQ